MPLIQRSGLFIAQSHAPIMLAICIGVVGKLCFKTDVDLVVRHNFPVTITPT